MGFASFEDIADAFAAGFEEDPSGAFAVDVGEEADKELVAGEDAVGHRFQREGIGEFSRAVELEPVGKEEEPDLRAVESSRGEPRR